jgi:RNA polymerase sigma factor (sigma-70 family)
LLSFIVNYAGNNSVNKTEYEILAACVKGDRSSQELLYKQFFGFAMGICLRYVSTKDEAIEIVHDSFMKVFLKSDQYKEDSSFKAWFKKIVINSSIDYLRKEKKHTFQKDISEANHVFFSETSTASLNHADLIKLVYALPPAYKLAFSMFAIDGFTHAEIAKSLGITEGTSKSNLSRAREILRKKLELLEIEKSHLPNEMVYKK